MHTETVSGFGDEWERFDQSMLKNAEGKSIFDAYFSIFPWADLPQEAVGFDLGCGSGRWAKFVSTRVGTLHCIDPSVAINVAKKNLAHQKNCVFHKASVDHIPLSDHSMDFGYALGVLHHIPDTQLGLNSCVKKLRPGAPFLLYIYYAFDNKPKWYFWLWKSTNLFRIFISHTPFFIRYIITQIIAIIIYFPLAKMVVILEKIGFNVANFPLSAYRDKSLYVMRTDALDRFGTQLEQRFTRFQIQTMMENAGLEKIKFSEELPFWCAVGYKQL